MKFCEFMQIFGCANFRLIYKKKLMSQLKSIVAKENRCNKKKQIVFGKTIH